MDIFGNFPANTLISGKLTIPLYTNGDVLGVVVTQLLSMRYWLVPVWSYVSFKSPMFVCTQHVFSRELKSTATHVDSPMQKS